MKKILMIHPYFGKTPEWFSEWLCTVNQLKDSRFNFLIVTDIDMTPFYVEKHIKILNTTLSELKEKISKTMGFNAALGFPYKLCDYKPAYGLIFYDYVKDYDFWGYGDIDILWGRLDKYITDDMLESYDRIGYLGHFSLYHNDDTVNHLFMKRGMFSYKKVYSDDYVYGFDEQSGMMYITLKNGVKTYLDEHFLNLDWRSKEFVAGGIKNYKYQVFYWENGGVYRAYIDNDNSLKTEEYMYLHFQGKKPKSINADKLKPQGFFITKDKFIVKDSLLTAEKIKELSSNKDTLPVDSANPSNRSIKKKFIDLLNKLKKQKNFKQRIIIIKKKIAQRYVQKNIYS